MKNNQQTKARPMTPKEVNELLMEMMGIPKSQRDTYRQIHKLA